MTKRKVTTVRMLRIISENPMGKTRKKSDKNMENYRKIVIADDSEADQKVIRAIIADVYRTRM